MAKQGMIQREKKRERLIAKYANKREALKDELKTVVKFKPEDPIKDYLERYLVYFEYWLVGLN